MSWTDAWGTRSWGTGKAPVTTTLPPSPPPTFIAIPAISAYGTRTWGGGSTVLIPSVTPPVAGDWLPLIIRHRAPYRAIVASFHRRHRFSFYIPQVYIRGLEYLVFNVGVHYPPPTDNLAEYMVWNVGFFGTNIRELTIPHKRWPLQPRHATLTELARPSTPLDNFVADLYESVGNVLARPEWLNYTTLEKYSSVLRAAGVSNPDVGTFLLPRSYETFGIRDAAQRVVSDYPHVHEAQDIADALVDITVRDHIRKTRIFFDMRRWATSPPTRLRVPNTQPDYLSHAINPLPHLPDDLQFVVRNIRNRMARQERTNLIKVQRWATDRFLNAPGSAIEYLLFDVISSGAIVSMGSGVSGGVIGQPLSTRVASARAAASGTARTRRGRVFWP